MSGKFSKKTRRAQARAAAKKGKKSNTALWIGLCILTALLILSVLFLLTLSRGQAMQLPEETQPTEQTRQTEAPTESAPELEITQQPLHMDNGLMITDIGKYTGVYMEDGTDEIVSGILMIVVKNCGEQDIQYAEISLYAGDAEPAQFSVSTLPAGASVVLLEKNRLEYDDAILYDRAETANVALFTEPVSMHEDTLKIQTVGGAINITNISDTDIDGDIVIYYKNSASDLYYGGITYRARIEGGLKAGELRQVMPAHFNADSCTVLFVTVS